MLCTASPKTVRKAFADRRNNPHSVEACYDPLKYKISFADLQTFWRCRPMSAEVQIRNESRFGQHAWSRWECHGIRVSAPMPLADSASPASPGPLCRFWTPNVGRYRPRSGRKSRFEQDAWSRWWCHGIGVCAPMLLVDSRSPAPSGLICRFSIVSECIFGLNWDPNFTNLRFWHFFDTRKKYPKI